MAQNDDISNATPITVSRISQSTTDATGAAGEDIRVGPQGAPSGKTVWFSYTAQQNGPVTLGTRGSNYDTTLQVFTLTNPAASASYGNLTEVASNDDGQFGGNPNNLDYYKAGLTFQAVAGRTYYIQAGGRQDEVGGIESGNLVLDVSPVVCFATGTLIRTARGEVAVEDLRVGDHAVTASGVLRPITWIGHREIIAKGEALPFHQQPVRIRAGAFGGGLPVRDLSLSPGHPVLVGADAGSEGGVLVPVMCLINGTTIARMPVETVTYWHVELDGHDILLAEGLPAESYIDGGDRAFFTEASDHALHNPDFVPAGWNARCRPVAADGPVVEAERQRLDTVFAGTLSEQCGWDAEATWTAA